MTQQEVEFEALMYKLKIKCVQGSEVGSPRIDYYLPEHDLLVELKTWESDRLLAQLRSITGRSILVLVGPNSVKAFENLLGRK